LVVVPQRVAVAFFAIVTLLFYHIEINPSPPDFAARFLIDAWTRAIIMAEYGLVTLAPWLALAFRAWPPACGRTPSISG
jgi:hypothetical protein